MAKVVLCLILAFARLATSFIPKTIGSLSSRCNHRPRGAATAEPSPSPDANPSSSLPPPEVISVLRQGSTSIGPASRSGTIFPGDFVVHRKLGIAQFVGVVSDPRWDEEVIRLIFKGEAEYIVEPDERSMLSRLKAADAAQPPKLSALTDLGRRRWEAQIEKVRDRAKLAAEDFLALYVARGDLTREPCPVDGDQFRAFEATFKHDPTPDQVKCFADVERDMVHRRTPMDRLVCGDVGFGKTEVAMRAIYRAVLAGRQVALLAPTTVLAAQHFRTLSARMPDVNVVLLRGGTSQTKDGKVLREKIANGSAQVTIGTHALLGKGVSFYKLELLVIDEEQRFGVAQKERLKAMSTGMDVLTLTATPIPRTLQMSLSGIRELSTLRSPPTGRKDVETHVVKFDAEVVKSAIELEMARNGQTFFVVPRISMIASAAEQIEQLVPDAVIGIAHGKIKRVDEVVLGFSEGRHDVLIATSVIESGLDLPNANTIIVMNPQHFGLAALYQLRGRVGRSLRQAFSYFMYPRDMTITVDALRRLQALKELSKLGAGFEVATRDLEIRGFGAIVGREQSGAADKVGPEVYLALLQEAIEDTRGTEIIASTDCVVGLPAAETILNRGLPSDFPLEGAKEEVMIAAVSVLKPREVNELVKQWRLRLGGTLPPTVEALFKIHQLEAFGRRLGVEMISLDGDDLLLEVPGWSTRIWKDVADLVDEVQSHGGADFDDDEKCMRLIGAGLQPPAKQLATLIAVLGRLYLHVEGKETFGF